MGMSDRVSGRLQGYLGLIFPPFPHLQLQIFNLIVAMLYMFDHVNDAMRISEFVIVPSDTLDQCIVEGESGLGVEHRRCSIPSSSHSAASFMAFFIWS